MGAVYCLVVCLLLYVQQGICLSVSTSPPEEHDVFTMTIRMPNVVSHKADSLLCTAAKLGPEETYITKFMPFARTTTAHHLSVFGCRSPPNNNVTWICDKRGPEYTICSAGPMLHVYAWSKDAPGTTLPQGVGMRVSGKTGYNYLVLQVHYRNVFPAGVTDNSGITFSMTHVRPEQQIGYILLGNWADIPPQRPVVFLDSMCQMNLTYPVYPIRYIAHAHDLGVVISGYRVRNGVWTNIGKMSPQLPQAFYPVNNPGIDIRNGDIITSRCIMNSMARTTNTVTGPTHHDEMVNFYIMYSTRNPDNLKPIYCFKDSVTYSWLSTFKAEEIPKESETIEGFPEVENVKKMFIWP